MKISRTILVALLCAFGIFNTSAQIKPLTKKKLNVKPIYPKMDQTIKDIIAGADLGIYKITMASRTLGPQNHKNVDNGYSSVLYNSTDKHHDLTKYDEVTVESSFYVKGKRDSGAARIRLSTTKLGGQKMNIYYTDGIDSGKTFKINNLKITKIGNIGYIITGDSVTEGRHTNYIFNIYKYVQT